MSGCDPQQWRNKNQVLKFQYDYDFKITLHMILVILNDRAYLRYWIPLHLDVLP